MIYCWPVSSSSVRALNPPTPPLKESFPGNPSNMATVERMAEAGDRTMRGVRDQKPISAVMTVFDQRI